MALPATIFCGMPGTLAGIALSTLLDGGVPVRAVVIPAPARLAGRPTGQAIVAVPPGVPARARGRWLPLAGAVGGAPVPSVRALADARGIPVYAVERLADAATLRALAGCHAAVFAVACFPWRLPPALLALPPLGCLNLHPSLLPANRGPDPLFWTFRRGERLSGVTVHLMDAGFDTGPILARRALPVPLGTTEAALERACAEAGGALLVGALGALAAGTARPRPQDERCASAYPLPAAEDYLITGARPASWAYGFASGVGARAEGVSIALGAARYRVRAALAYDDGARQAEAALWAGDVVSLACAPGAFRARVVLPAAAPAG